MGMRWTMGTLLILTLSNFAGWGSKYWLWSIGGMWSLTDFLHNSTCNMQIWPLRGHSIRVGYIFSRTRMALLLNWETGLQLDAQAGFDYVTNDPELSELPVVIGSVHVKLIWLTSFLIQVIFGQSLGGAVAIYAASRNSDKASFPPGQGYGKK